jgi:hypothetical protein
MRAAQTTICADAALTQSARRRVRIGASRSGRRSCAARIQEWLSPRCRGSHLRAVEAAVVCSPIGSGATMRSALHACLRRRSFCSECGEVPNRRAHRLLRCGTSFSKPLRFEPADSQCSVLDPSSPVPPGSIASNRSTFGGGEGWIKRSQDSAISSQVRFSDSLRVNRQTCRLFQLQRYFGHRGVGRAELEKAVRAAAGRGREHRAPSLGYFFIRLFLRPWADCGCWVCCATRGIARAACGARLSRSVA